MRSVLLFLCTLFCVLCLAGCQKEDVLHMGLDAEILEIQEEEQRITVQSLHEDGPLGDSRTLDCSQCYVLYVDYETGDVDTIDFDTLQAGDHVILSVYQSQLDALPEETILAQQVQLGTQRLS